MGGALLVVRPGSDVNLILTPRRGGRGRRNLRSDSPTQVTIDRPQLVLGQTSAFLDYDVARLLGTEPLAPTLDTADIWRWSLPT